MMMCRVSSMTMIVAGTGMLYSDPLFLSASRCTASDLDLERSLALHRHFSEDKLLAGGERYAKGTTWVFDEVEKEAEHVAVATTVATTTRIASSLPAPETALAVNVDRESPDKITTAVAQSASSASSALRSESSVSAAVEDDKLMTPGASATWRDADSICSSASVSYSHSFPAVGCSSITSSSNWESSARAFITTAHTAACAQPSSSSSAARPAATVLSVAESAVGVKQSGAKQSIQEFLEGFEKDSATIKASSASSEQDASSEAALEPAAVSRSAGVLSALQDWDAESERLVMPSDFVTIIGHLCDAIFVVFIISWTNLKMKSDYGVKVDNDKGGKHMEIASRSYFYVATVVILFIYASG